MGVLALVAQSVWRSNFSMEMGEGGTWCHSSGPKRCLTDMGRDEPAHKN